MAISPLDKVSAVVEYAVSRIPAQKLTLGIPNYGYNWTLPYIMGERRARSLGNVEANELAKEKRAAIEFDTVAAAPHFRYFDRVAGAPEEHEVWFENARSIDALARLVNTFGLDGIGIWNGMRPFPQLWQVINALYPIRKILS